MGKSVTVKEALRRGRIKLFYLPMTALFGTIILATVLSSLQLIPAWTIPVSIVVGFIASWLTWSYFVNQWKVWAFENVRNIHELQRKAIDQRLIWKSGSWFEKTEFQSPEQKQKLKSLEEKFLEDDIYNDDLRVPKETAIFYSKSKLFWSFIAVIAFICGGIYLITSNEYWGYFLAGLGVILGYFEITKTKKLNEPQIIISDKGIKIENKHFVPWNVIRNDHVYTKHGSNSSTTYLVFNNENIVVDELDTNADKLEHLLRVYRVRFENKNS
ncbi:hypothetical protein ACFFLS_03405 [Flavobacterium procerum]|uniref:PH domain-containing protein n=1 Tax=Flavobacterium procerum TaxID=1455569 RepID=A0ABV6BKU8_9FLAO